MIARLSIGLLLITGLSSSPLLAQGALNDEGHLVDFARDVIPILKSRCLECHGPEDAKNDFRVDDPDIMADYIEAGDAGASSLYIDYIVSEDPDMMMPPESHGGPMKASEIALIKVWIEEGANWPDDAAFVEDVKADESVVAEKKEKVARGLIGRVWGFQGYLHPATVHFPVALFVFGALFVVLGWKWPQLAHPIPMACLLGGALSAAVSSAMGWSLADENGWGSWTRGLDAPVARHRWAGIGLTITAVAFSIIAIKAELRNNLRLRKVWQTGLLICATIVGVVGHIGGELTYGPTFYERAFNVLWGIEDEDKDEDKEKASSDTHGQVSASIDAQPATGDEPTVTANDA